MKKVKVSTIYLFFCVPVFLLCIAGFFHPFQHLLLGIAESFLKRSLDASWWMPRIRIFSTMAIFILLTIIFFCITQTGKIIGKQIAAQINEFANALIRRKENRGFFLFLFAVFIVEILTIIRANYSYMDDLGRSSQGYNHLDTWSRFLAGGLAMIVHASPRLMDISPLPQVLACFILALGAFTFAYIATKGKPTFFSIIAALPIGLSPYFLENLTFKFDAPYMALSVVCSIFPFLFIHQKRSFIVVSIFGLLGTCLTYQSASGVYIVLTLFLTFLFWHEKDWNEKKVFSFLILAAACYAGTLLGFRIFFMTDDASYASTGMLSLTRFFPGIMQNLLTYLTYLYKDLGNSVSSIFLMLILIFCILQSFNNKRRNFFLSLPVMFTVFILMTCVSFGAYLALEEPLWNPRAFAGVGILISAFCMFSVTGGLKSKQKIAAGIAVILFCYTLLTFALCYGNTLSEQKNFNVFRTTLLVADLGEVCRDMQEVRLHINNDFESAPTVTTAAAILPLAQRLNRGILGDGRWGYHYLSQYFHFNFLKVKAPIDDSDFLVLKENLYHVIRGKDNLVTVTFKEIIPQEKDWVPGR